MESKFFAFMSRMRYIDRWSLMRNTVKENNAEHSLMVCFIAHNLAVIENKMFGGDYDACRIGMIAAYHEASEVITGDMPTPIKYYNPDIRDAYKQVEAIACRKLTGMLPQRLQDIYAGLLTPADPQVEELVKAADKLSAHIKCLEEEKAGNHEFCAAARQTRQALADMHLPEVDLFLEEFLPSFRLTLDELE